MIVCVIVCLVDWLVGLLIDSSFDWLLACLFDSLPGWLLYLFDDLCAWLLVCLIFCLGVCLVDDVSLKVLCVICLFA